MGRGESGDLTQEAVRPAGRSLTGRASLNAVASGLDYGVRAIVELIVSPLLVAGLGAQMFGAWRVLWQWSGYVWGASGRSAQALQYAIANRQWTATPLEKRRLVGCAIVVWLCFLPLMLLAGALGVWLGPAILDVPSDQVAQFRVAAAILAVDAMVLTLTTLPRSTGTVRKCVRPLLSACTYHTTTPAASPRVRKGKRILFMRDLIGLGFGCQPVRRATTD